MHNKVKVKKTLPMLGRLTPPKDKIHNDKSCHQESITSAECHAGDIRHIAHILADMREFSVLFSGQ